jgi:hypothetical protein
MHDCASPGLIFLVTIYIWRELNFFKANVSLFVDFFGTLIIKNLACINRNKKFGLKAREMFCQKWE